MTEESRAWLKALQESIWIAKRGLRSVGMRQEEFTYMEETRRLTPEEWSRLETILKAELPLTELQNTNFGFGCGMIVYDDPVDPVYPGVPQEVPEVLLCVDKNHLPLEGRTRETKPLRGLPKLVPADRTSFEDGWVAFSPYTHDPANAARLVAVGRPAPRSKGYYEY